MFRRRFLKRVIKLIKKNFEISRLNIFESTTTNTVVSLDLFLGEGEIHKLCDTLFKHLFFFCTTDIKINICLL